MRDFNGDEWIKLEIPLEDLPAGTKARALGGGYWIKSKLGWEWPSGGVFPRPGGDWSGMVSLPRRLIQNIETGNYEEVSEEGYQLHEILVRRPPTKYRKMLMISTPH